MDIQIRESLIKRFDRYRIVFWIDEQNEWFDAFHSLEIEGVEKVVLSNNEFALKYRLLREEPKQKFLIYRSGPSPGDLENWLLDVQLAQCEFRADPVSLWLSELNLRPEFAGIVESHMEFFRSGKRRERLKHLLISDDTRETLPIKMMAVCAESVPRIEEIFRELIAECAIGRNEKLSLIERCGLKNVLWQEMARSFGYYPTTPGILDFVIELFKFSYFRNFEPNQRSQPIMKMTPDALVFLKGWKDSSSRSFSFKILSERCAEALAIKQDLEKRNWRELVDLDDFSLIDRKILHDLVSSVGSRIISLEDVKDVVRKRRQTQWFKDVRHEYEAVSWASHFFREMSEVKISINSFDDGILQYSRSWFRIDQIYRKFIYHVGQSGQTSLMEALSHQIENLYANNYLLDLNDRWQVFVDESRQWGAKNTSSQKNFFSRWIKPFLKKNNKICVIISDALRFEIGEELLTRILQEDRYEARLSPALSLLPSYTQLGMAALLPHEKLAFSDNESGTVLVDGQRSDGLENRSRILAKAISQGGKALHADELLNMNGESCRALVRDHAVLYIYHNHIDATGDSRKSEERVFDAVETTFEELIRLMRKLAGANVNNMLITSDHGFLYQAQKIDESDFSGADVQGKEVLNRDRRFVLGKGLKENAALRKFTSSELGLAGDMEIQIPKSIHRLRQKGSGSQFVHGGASLQEVVIPVIEINKKRMSDVRYVEVEIHRGATTAITSGQLGVTFYQTEPVTEKVQKRSLRAGIYTKEGELISDYHDLIFERESNNPRDREVQIRFMLTQKADEANSKEVILRLDEKIPETSQYREYKSVGYTMRRSFTSDFDF